MKIGDLVRLGWIPTKGHPIYKNLGIIVNIRWGYHLGDTVVDVHWAMTDTITEEVGLYIRGIS